MARSNRLMIEVTVGSRPIVTAMRVMGKFAPEPIGILRAVARRVVKIAHFRETFEKVYSGRWELVFMAALAEPEFANLPAAWPKVFAYMNPKLAGTDIVSSLIDGVKDGRKHVPDNAPEAAALDALIGLVGHMGVGDGREAAKARIMMLMMNHGITVSELDAFSAELLAEGEAEADQ